MKRVTQKIKDILAQADEIKEMTTEELAALPNIMGIVARAKVKEDGFYTYRDLTTNKKVLIFLKVA